MPAADFDDVLIVPKVSSVRSRKDVDLFVYYKFGDGKQSFTGIPLIAANMATIGTPKMALSLAELGVATALHKNTNERIAKPLVNKKAGIFFSTGLEKNLDKFQGLVEDSLVCLDVANGYMTHFHEYVKAVRKAFPRFVIMAGNVATPAGVMALYEAGADIVKIGIGPGSVCTTRLKTGVGYPQFDAIVDCYTQTEHCVRLCADGGCKNPGDVAKAFGAGADFVMTGALFAGTSEAGKHYYGEASPFGKKAVEEYQAYEGKSTSARYRGTAQSAALNILGGLRSACSYTGHKKLEDFIGNVEFVTVNRTHNTLWETHA